MVFRKKKSRKSKKKKNPLDEIKAGWDEFDKEVKIPGISVKFPNKRVPVRTNSWFFRRSGIGIIPSILLIIGIIWLLKILGYVSADVFWPVLLIVVALYLILRRTFSFF